MQKSYDVAVIFGGISSENEVSVITGTMVCNVLKKGGKSVLPVYIDPAENCTRAKNFPTLQSTKTAATKNIRSADFAAAG